ncbi:hypothetical protein M405DRAFT_440839 [Rhizopogon salebrosus TDB-379]|nr:hypothetical protein M405DRAFT_440839 [Rhizopogon salebrosus TDB-379]
MINHCIRFCVVCSYLPSSHIPRVHPVLAQKTLAHVSLAAVTACLNFLLTTTSFIVASFPFHHIINSAHHIC